MKKRTIIIIEEEEDKQLEFDDWYKDYNNGWDLKPYHPCTNCPNNPSNNPYATGFCCCSLPYLYNPTCITNSIEVRC